MQKEGVPTEADVWMTFLLLFLLLKQDACFAAACMQNGFFFVLQTFATHRLAGYRAVTSLPPKRSGH